MDLRRVIEIIVEEVERALALSRIKVGALHFGSAADELLTAARAINGEAACAPADGAEQLSGVDALFVDYLPPPVAAEIALGLAFSPAAALVHQLLRQGKSVFLLKPSPESAELTGAYGGLYKNYWKALAAYGVVYLGAADGAATDSAGNNDGTVRRVRRSGRYCFNAGKSKI
ncbi:MAG: hypothetical protein LBG72_00690 [Spirochaetaceae bacterium]|jgi:hypothetical protein|nr:hypothetical protein [Spirochaetaceae bacterium]